MATTSNKLRRPAYSKALETAVGKPVTEIMVEVHIGHRAWDRVRRVDLNVSGRPIRKHTIVGIPPQKVCYQRHEGKWWGAMGYPLVVPLDQQTTVSDYDFTCLDRLYVLLDASDCSYQTACDCARRICEHGAAKVILIHPHARSGWPGSSGWDVYVGAPR
jgi:hypothetical protein